VLAGGFDYGLVQMASVFGCYQLAGLVRGFIEEMYEKFVTGIMLHLEMRKGLASPAIKLQPCPSIPVFVNRTSCF